MIFLLNLFFMSRIIVILCLISMKSLSFNFFLKIRLDVNICIFFKIELIFLNRGDPNFFTRL